MGKKLHLIRRDVFSVFLMTSISLMTNSMAEVYTVGDGDGWDTDVNYSLWSEKYNFTVGDVLEFRYSKDSHNVYEVTEDTFRSCNASSGVLATYFSGNDEISLNQTMKYWFICNVADHCLDGMRFGIQVSSSNSTNSVLSPPPPPPPASGSAPTPPPQRWIAASFFMILGIIKL